MLTASLPSPGLDGTGDVRRKSVRFDTFEDRSVISLSGEIDLGIRDLLVQCLDAAIGAQRDVVVDVARVTFMDASSLGAIAVAVCRLEAQGLTCQLRDPAPCCRRLFRLCDLERWLESPGTTVGASCNGK